MKNKYKTNNCMNCRHVIYAWRSECEGVLDIMYCTKNLSIPDDEDKIRQFKENVKEGLIPIISHPFLLDQWFMKFHPDRRVYVVDTCDYYKERR